MKFRLSADPKVNPVGGRSVPLGFGRFVDVEPGGEFDVIDVQLAGNPTFVESGLFEPVDDEARSVVEKANAPAVDESKSEDVEPEQDPTAGGEDPVLAAAKQAAAEAAGDPADLGVGEPVDDDTEITPDNAATVIVTDPDGTTRQVTGELPEFSAVPGEQLSEIPAQPGSTPIPSADPGQPDELSVDPDSPIPGTVETTEKPATGSRRAR